MACVLTGMSGVTRILEKLSANDPPRAAVVKLRFLAGLTMPEVATALEISLSTAERHWTYARSWLYAEMAIRPSPIRFFDGP